MLLHHCWRCSAANTSIGTTQTGSVVSKPEPWLSLGRAVTYKTIVKALYGMVKSHTRMFPSRVELQHSWESFFCAWACVRVEPQDAEKQTLPDWQLTKILCIQVAAAERLVLLPQSSLRSYGSSQRETKHTKTLQKAAVEREILNTNTKQIGFTDSVTKVCGLLSSPCQWKLWHDHT